MVPASASGGEAEHEQGVGSGIAALVRPSSAMLYVLVAVVDRMKPAFWHLCTVS